jgi:hypothetical protein
VIGGLFLVFVIAIILFRGYRNKVKTNKILDQQKEQIETLVLNILPSEVAQELKVHGYAKPKYFDHVSVLFTDFKGFTKIADELSPHEVVTELNECFIAFDEIIGRYGLEKIKTIGDSYMCAGGIPTPNDDHPVKMVKAGLEIREYIRKRNEIRSSMGLPAWELRIGIHVGPIVAGVVGRKNMRTTSGEARLTLQAGWKATVRPARLTFLLLPMNSLKSNTTALIAVKFMPRILVRSICISSTMSFQRNFLLTFLLKNIRITWCLLKGISFKINYRVCPF